MGILERKQKVFYKKTKKGNIIKIVREHYLRDDVYCGLDICHLCEGDNKPLEVVKKSNSTLVTQPHHLVVDTNVALRQIDLLCQSEITNVIILQTVIQEVKHQSLPVYKTLRDLIDTPSKHFFVFTNEHHSDCFIERESSESADDRNDRAIRLGCWWYQQHFSLFNQNAVLLTNDIVNRDKARKLEIQAYTAFEYVSSLKDSPGLLDIVSIPEENIEDSSEKKFFYPPHWSLIDIRAAIKVGKLFQGVLKTSRNNYLEANVMVEGSEKSALVQGKINLNRALHDDLVAIEILPEEQWSAPLNVVLEEKEEEEKVTEEEDQKSLAQEQELVASNVGHGDKQPTARIVGIVRRKWRQYCGILKKNDIVESTRHLFVPSDKRIPFVRIQTRQADLYHNKRILVAIDSWQRDSKNPRGHFVRVIGDIGDKEAENEVVLLEHDCPHSKFSEAVLNCLPPTPWLITPKDESEREDLRQLDICSVDPVGCTDIDDALHCRKLANGNYEVGVHIADVSHFIRPNTALDREAQNRATSVYLSNRRIDMVPELLSTNLCSLRGEVDRFAFSIIWEMSPKSKILSSRFCKSIIRSRKEMTYQEAQQRIDDPSLQDNLTLSLRSLNKLAKRLKKNRLEEGALVLASMEVKFHVDPDNDSVIDIVAKQHLETMSMVEEFMLLANISAAETTYRHFPSCSMLRRHPAPPVSNYEPLLAAARSQGIEIDVTSNKTLSESLNTSTKENNPFFNSMLRIMTTRCMMQALYFSSGTLEKPEFFHYGLATPYYTHFTSPIRRYADIIVHRLLAVIIEKENTYPELLDSKKCADLAQHINYRHKMAQYASRSSGVITSIAALRGSILEYDSYILLLHKNAIQVLVPTIGQQLTLYLDAHTKDARKRQREAEKAKRSGILCKQEVMEVDESSELEELPKFDFNEKELCLRCGSLELRPFDHLKVQISVDSTDVQHEKVVVRLVEPFIKGFSVPSIHKENPQEVNSQRPPPSAKPLKKKMKKTH